MISLVKLLVVGGLFICLTGCIGLGSGAPIEPTPVTPFTHNVYTNPNIWDNELYQSFPTPTTESHPH